MKRLRLTSVSTSSPRSSFGQASENAPGRRRRPWPIPMCRHVMYTVYYVILRTYNTAWPKMSENVIISMHMCICIYVYTCLYYILMIASSTSPLFIQQLPTRPPWLSSMAGCHQWDKSKIWVQKYGGFITNFCPGPWENVHDTIMIHH